MVSTVVWIVSGFLGVAFAMAGMMKGFMVEKAAEKMDWVDKFGRDKAKLVGYAEIIGAMGLILPIALDIAPILSGIAAACLAVLMISAVFMHFKWDDAKNSIAPAVLGALSAFVAFSHLA